MTDEIQFSRLDYAFSRFLTQRSQLEGGQGKNFAALVLRLSYAQSRGHSCIETSNEEQGILLASGMVNELGTLPLVLEKQQLYLQRYWYYECQIAKKLATLSYIEPAKGSFTELIEQYFPATNEVDWQKQAAIAAVKSPFTIVTGGPGTGKTTTVVKILALLQELSAAPLNIALAAPTGKAAMRLQQSIGQSKNSLPCSEFIKDKIPEQVVTIHRLLGARPPSPYFRYNADSPLPYDIVVLDEVSMIDLPLMSKLVSALKAHARLILLGDKDQLASVETGSVLADLTDALPEYTQELKKSYRFSGHIKTFAEAVNTQEALAAWELLEQNYADVCLLEEELIAYIVARQLGYLQLIADNAEFTQVYAAFNEFQVLCANRQGLYSVEDVNYRVTQALKEQKLIQGSGEWYVGRPVLITQNDAVLHLYNGDIGLCLADSENNGQLMAFFLLADGTIRKYLPARLPRCETVFAMTIHKSQGSEFNEVLLLLPEVINPILTKELIYTGITRAKKVIKMVTNKAVFVETLQRKVKRSSGLADRLRDIA
ncbi:MAG: exodeoxyribonuclease V subunit alpha [Methyloprofundus sp.]|nr:exodeoxyribonuclease V subunit alpha [Methyloprofundus sp.]